MKFEFSRMPKGILYWLLIPAFFSSCSEEQKAKQAPPPSIQVVEVIQKDVPIYNYFVGQIYGHEDISINARVEGFLTGMHFKEGSRVKKGKLLYTIDAEPFKAEVASKQSKVAEAQTLLVNAENELARYKPLAEIDAVSKSDLDAAQANRDASIAAVKAAEASLRMAEINLSYTNVKSPITGFIGKTQARVGEFVGRSPNPVILNTVSSIESVRVQFFITESQYLILAREYSINRSFDDQNNTTKKAPNLTLILSDGSTHPYKGKADFVNREVDSETGAMLVQASFPNPDLILRPGQFSRVKVRMKDEKGALLVPQRCVNELQGRYSVFIVNSENKIESRQIEISEKIGDYYIASSGLNQNDKVVLEGLQKVGSGMEVNPILTEFESQTQEQ
jgi:membrane fusion protein, multidrug efflux system